MSLEAIRSLLVEARIWIEGDCLNSIEVQLPLGDELKIIGNSLSDYLVHFRLKGRFVFLSNYLPLTSNNIDENGYTQWMSHTTSPFRLVDIISRLNDTEIGLRNQVQAQALVVMGALQKQDIQRPLFQRVTKNIVQWIGRLYYAAALERARESL